MRVARRRPQAERYAAATGVIRTVALGLGMVPLLALAGLLATGLIVEGTQPPLEPSDAIIVISGDEDQARLHEGLRLWRQNWAPRLIFSGAAREGPISKRRAMVSRPQTMSRFFRAGEKL